MKLLLTPKHNRKHIYGTFSNIKTAHLQQQRYQPRNDHQNSTSRNALDCLTGTAKGELIYHEGNILSNQTITRKLQHTVQLTQTELENLMRYTWGLYKIK